jgi:hypothetical protein
LPEYSLVLKMWVRIPRPSGNFLRPKFFNRLYSELRRGHVGVKSATAEVFDRPGVA